MIIDILTIFPDLLHSPLQEGILRKAQEEQRVQIRAVNIRDFASDRHHTTDDRPFGGGEGMVMKAEPLAAAVASVQQAESLVILLSPQGERFEQRTAEKLAEKKHLILVCGRYEGVDERFRQACVDVEYSIGDYVLTGGELAALVICDTVTRLLPGVLGCQDSVSRDTFSRCLLKHPQYTRPPCWREMLVPEVLLSGNHQQIEEYRFLQSVRQTMARRPELLLQSTFSTAEKKILRRHGLGNVASGDIVPASV